MRFLIGDPFASAQEYKKICSQAVSSSGVELTVIEAPSPLQRWSARSCNGGSHVAAPICPIGDRFQHTSREMASKGERWLRENAASAFPMPSRR
jgi:hypothetical protein